MTFRVRKALGKTTASLCRARSFTLAQKLHDASDELAMMVFRDMSEYLFYQALYTS